MASASLKQRYSSKWSRAAWRERVVYTYLQPVMDRLGLVMVASGVGTLTDKYYERYHSDVMDKYDFIVVPREVYGRKKQLAVDDVLCFIDVTGFGGREPCVLSVKVLYAAKHGIADRVILVHLNDSTGALRWVTAAYVLALAQRNKVAARKLYSDEKDYYCLKTSQMNYVGRIQQFLEMLKTYHMLKVIN